LLEPRQERDTQAFVTGGAYSLFQYSRSIGSFPLLALVLAALIGVTCVLGAAGMGSAAGALVPAVGWFVVSIVLTLPTASGSVIIANTAAGKWYLYGGSACAAVGVVVAFMRRSRTAVRQHQSS
jgi:hypothetical protein